MKRMNHADMARMLYSRPKTRVYAALVLFNWIHLRVEQFDPIQRDVQLQVNPKRLFIQVPLFAHEVDVQ